MGHRLVIGCGYLGLRVAKKWVSAGHLVTATTRSEERAVQLREQGIKPLISDIISDQNPLPQADVILYAVGFDRCNPDQSISQVFVDGMARTIARVTDPVQRFLYISSTGVYGQTDSELVDEATICQPIRDGGKACLMAEELLSQARWSGNSIRLRMAGLYGANRIPYQRAIRAGEEISAPAEGHLNLIHIEDAVDIVLHFADARTAPPLLLVSDGNPVIRADYYAEIAQQLGAPPAKLQTPKSSSHVAQRAGGSKRISNRQLMQHYGKPLRYPDYRAGIAETLREEERETGREGDKETRRRGDTS